MGNYVQSLRSTRSPEQEQEQRQSAWYYDWSLPKYNPFKSEIVVDSCNCTRAKDKNSVLNSNPNSESSSQSSTPSQSPSQSSSKSSSSSSHQSPTPKILSPKEIENSSDVNKQDPAILRSALTSTTDATGQKPANLHKTQTQTENPKQTSSKIPLSTKRLSAKKSTTLNTNIMKPHTVNREKYSNSEDQAKIESAVNVHKPK